MSNQTQPSIIRSRLSRSRFAAVILGGASITLAGCVETLPQAMSTIAGPTAAQLQGDWTGRYVCGQGQTAVRLQLQATGGNALTGRFDFGNIAGRTNAANGSFTVNGSTQLGRLDLAPGRWLVQPRGYQMISVQANYFANPERLVGTVTSPGCSTFEVVRARPGG